MEYKRSLAQKQIFLEKVFYEVGEAAEILLCQFSANQSQGVERNLEGTFGKIDKWRIGDNRVWQAVFDTEHFNRVGAGKKTESPFRIEIGGSGKDVFGNADSLKG